MEDNYIQMHCTNGRYNDGGFPDNDDNWIMPSKMTELYYTRTISLY